MDLLLIEVPICACNNNTGSQNLRAYTIEIYLLHPGVEVNLNMLIKKTLMKHQGFFMN